MYVNHVYAWCLQRSKEGISTLKQKSEMVIHFPLSPENRTTSPAGGTSALKYLATFPFPQNINFNDKRKKVNGSFILILHPSLTSQIRVKEESKHLCNSELLVSATWISSLRKRAERCSQGERGHVRVIL